MIIVLEGPDNSGKSTLAEFLSNYIKFPIVPSEGPEKYPGEMSERIERYSLKNNVIFDRHPCISQPIYSQFNNTTPVNPGQIEQFYARKPLTIYCAGRGLVGHVRKEGYDTDDHIKHIEENYRQIEKKYNRWATEKALIFYRIGYPMHLILNLVEGFINGQRSSRVVSNA